MFLPHIEKWCVCSACPLHKYTSTRSYHRGSFNPKILFVGDAPGESEDSCGLPFIGVTGQLINEIIQEAGIEGKYRAFTNTVICTPYKDKQRKAFREPVKEELKACSSRLKEIINILSPQKIVALGPKAKQALIMLKLEHLQYASGLEILKKGGKGSVAYKRLVLQLRQLKEELGI